MQLRLYISAWLKLCLIIALGLLRARGEEWKTLLPEARSVTSMAVAGQSVWLLSPGENGDGLRRYTRGEVAGFPQAAFAPDNPFWYPLRLHSDGKTVYVDRLRIIPQPFPQESQIHAEVVRKELDFSPVPMQGQLVYLDDSVAYTFVDGKYDPSRILRWRAGQSEVVVDSLQVGSRGPLKRLTFFLPDRDGGFWFGSEDISDITNLSGLYRINPRGTPRVAEVVVAPHTGDCCADGALDSQGRLYLASRIGLLQYDKGAIKNLTESDRRIRAHVGAVMVDGKGVVWAGTGENDSSFQVVVVQDGKVGIKKTLMPAAGTLGGVTDIVEDAGGHIWVAGLNMPVQVYHADAVTATRPFTAAPRGPQPQAGRMGVPYRGRYFNLLGLRLYAE